MTTSCASFSWARPAMRRAGSSDVKTCAKCSRASQASIEPERLDQLRNRVRNQVVDQLAARDALANFARRDRQRLDLEELDALRTRELRQHRIEAVARVARARPDGQTRPRDHSFRVLPRQDVTELVGADPKQRFPPAARLPPPAPAL